MLLSRESSQRRNVTCGKENRMDFSIKYIDAILRFIVKRVSRRIMLREMRFLRARFSYPFFLYSARNTEDQKSGMREKEREREFARREGAKGILDPWLLTFRKSLSSIISRGSRFPDVAGNLLQHEAIYCTYRTVFARVRTQLAKLVVYLYDVRV